MNNQHQPILPAVNSLLGETALMCGMRRSGKSTAITIMAEELGRYYCPLDSGDSEDEYGPLSSRSSNHTTKEAQQWTTSISPS